jgi:phosphoglycolate phosphatase/AHBA synthesis associated protein
MQPRAVLFDMDGVLVRSEEIWFRLLEEAGRRFRGRPVTREEFAPTFGQGTSADCSVFGLECSPEQLDQYYVENFRRYLGGVWVDPEAAPLLDGLRAQGIRIEVVTNTVTELARSVLEKADLLQRLDGLSCADMVSKPKPAPDLIHHALEVLSVRADDAWYVGDSRFDREAAGAAGVRFVGLRIRGDARIEQLKELEALVRSA